MFTIPNYTSPQHQLSLESAFGVIDSINLNYGYRSMAAVADPNAPTGINVNANVTIYASKKAYDDKAQPLHSRNVSFQHANDDLTTIKSLVAEELSN